MSALQIIMTNAGRAALVAAGTANTLPVTIASVGVTATAVTASAASTTLPGEIKRIATVGGAAVAADTLHLVVRDEGTDAYSIRSFALYLADGTLFAIYGQPSSIIDKSAQATLLVAIDVVFADIAATSITFGNANFLNPPATTSVAGVVELADDAESLAMVDALRSLTPRGLGLVLTASRILQQLITVDGAGSGLDADLLDGRDGSWYTAIADRLGYVPANRAGDIFTGNVALQVPAGGERNLQFAQTSRVSYLFANTTTFGAFDTLNGAIWSYTFADRQFYIKNSVAWNAGNDGNGSGLDADLLDGQDGSWYSDINGRLGYQAFATNGSKPMNGNVTFDGASDRRLAWTTPGAYFYGVTDSVGLYDALNARPVWFYTQSNQTTNFNTALSVGGAIRRANNPVWDAGNDGNGSGLDADLLDGQDGSWYSDINARLGYQAFAANGSKVMNGNVTFDGASDRRVAWTTPGVHFYGVPDSFGLYDDTNSRPVWFYTPSSQTCVFNTSINVGGFLRRNNNLVWDAGNDGAGSGLDADMLDGHHAGDFALAATFAGLQDPNGFQKLPSGLIVQWGQAGHGDNSGRQPVSFPVPFPSACLNAVATNDANGVPVAFHGVGSPNQEGMTVWSAATAGGPALAGTAFRWIAIGY